MSDHNAEYYDQKWRQVLAQMPTGGEYRFDLRAAGYKIISDHIGHGKRVFDFACGVSILGDFLRTNGCSVDGCDWSPVAITYAKRAGGKWIVGNTVEGEYDFIVATYFLEHIPFPEEWLNKMFKHAPKVICSIPNNFRKVGEHSEMAWKDWEEFHLKFGKYGLERLDVLKYDSRIPAAWQHPTFEFSRVEK